MANAGRILILPKGDWEETTTYENLDLVRHNNTSWLAKQASVGIEPSSANSEYWQNMFENRYVPPTRLIDNRYVDAKYSISGNVCFVYLGNATEELEMNTKYLVGRLPQNILQLAHASYVMNGRTWVVNAELSSVYVNCTTGPSFPEDNKPQLAFTIPLMIQ
jgi:hypothetical protein